MMPHAAAIGFLVCSGQLHSGSGPIVRMFVLAYVQTL